MNLLETSTMISELQQLPLTTGVGLLIGLVLLAGTGVSFIIGRKILSKNMSAALQQMGIPPYSELFLAVTGCVITVASVVLAVVTISRSHGFGEKCSLTGGAMRPRLRAD